MDYTGMLIGDCSNPEPQVTQSQSTPFTQIGLYENSLPSSLHSATCIMEIKGAT